MAKHRGGTGAGRGVDIRWESVRTAEGVSPRLFAWLARTGIGVRSGSRPIGWVQQHNMAAYDAIERAAKDAGVGLSSVCVRNGVVYASGVAIGTVDQFFRIADAR